MRPTLQNYESVVLSDGVADPVRFWISSGSDVTSENRPDPYLFDKMYQSICSTFGVTYFYNENIFLWVLILLNISDRALLNYILLWQFVCQNFQNNLKNALLEKIPKDFPNFLLFVVLYNTISFTFNNETEKLRFHRVQKVILHRIYWSTVCSDLKIAKK